LKNGVNTVKQTLYIFSQSINREKVNALSANYQNPSFRMTVQTN
jgi:hypothetical protein